MVALGATAGALSAPVTVPASVLTVGGMVIGGFISHYAGERVEDGLNWIWDRAVEPQLDEIMEKAEHNKISLANDGNLVWQSDGYADARQNLLESSALGINPMHRLFHRASTVALRVKRTTLYPNEMGKLLRI